MRKFVFFVVAVSTCAAMAQESAVTYSTVAVSAKKALEEVSRQSGAKLQCSAAMENEILILRLQNAPLDEVMRRIAAVTSGAWSKEGDIYYLTPDRSARQAEENRQRQRLAEKLSAAIKKGLDPKKPGSQVSGRAGGLSMSITSDASNQAMYKLAAAIGPNQLAAVPEGGRIVFSSNANQMQRSLPAGTDAVISQFVTEYNKAAAAAKQDEPAKDAQDENMAAFMQLFGNRIQKPQPITSAPAKALAIASRRGMFMGYTLELKLYDANGKVVASNMLQLSTSLPFDPEAFMKPQTPPASQGPEIELSPLSKELYGASRSFSTMGGASNLKYSKELMDSLRDPVEHDPLSYAESEALITIAKTRNEQLVADLPDGILSFFGNLSAKGKLTAESFLKDIQGEQKAKVDEAAGWLVVSPDDPVRSRKERLDRAALRTFIRTAQLQGSVTLDDVAAYALRNGSPMDDAPASATYIMLFAPSALQQGFAGAVNWDLVKLYGMLGDVQRQSLRQGSRLAFGTLSPPQQNQVSKLVFGADATLQIQNPRGPQQPQQDPISEMITTQIDRFLPGAGGDYRTEPTEVMPNGLPQDGYILVNFTSEPVGQPQTMSTDLGRGATMGSMELGLFKFFKDDPNMSQIGGMMPTLDDMKMGTRSVYNFSFFVAPSVAAKGTLNDDRIPKDAPIYKMSALPSDFQKRIDDMAASFKKNPIWGMVARMGGMNRGVPPQ